MDLRLVQAAVGGFYYRDALPVLGLTTETGVAGVGRPAPSSGAHRPAAAAAASAGVVSFSVGDKVKVTARTALITSFIVVVAMKLFFFRGLLLIP